MSNKQIVVNAKQIISALKKLGFAFERQSSSHAIYVNHENVRVTIPIHGKKDIGKGLLKQILTDAKITSEDLKKLI